MHPHLEYALQTGNGLVSRREHPELVEAIKRECRAGTLIRVLSGVYLASGVGESLEHRTRALLRLDPDAIVTGAAAASLSWWPELPAPVIDAYRRWQCRPADGFRWLRGEIPSELVRQQFAAPSLQVLDLIPVIGSRSVDEALRRRAVSVSGLEAALALTPGRAGNQVRTEVLTDSRDEPWSPAEREFHRVLRAARITGWRTNYPLHLDGHTYFLDVALPGLRLAFEIDGFEHHGSRTSFERDRARDARLATHNWQSTRITAAQVGACAETVVGVINARATLLQRQFPRRRR